MTLTNVNFSRHILTPVAAKSQLAQVLLARPKIDRNMWQSDAAPSPVHEVPNVILDFHVPNDLKQWQKDCEPDLPWAETHFQERVSGEPLNPPPSYVDWPWHNKEHAEQFIRDGGKFDHTYPERFWPYAPQGVSDDQCRVPYHGEYGDVMDVVIQLQQDPWTRQAYLPIWWPEDTGVTRHQRVPCTLGYHFIRNGAALDCNYFLRSCDITRHLHNDIYFTGRLLQWVFNELDSPVMMLGKITIFISNLHMFANDEWRFNR